MTSNEVVFSVALASATFLAGLYAGDERAAVALQPCPQGGAASLISAAVSGQLCTYAEIVRGGKRIKWTIQPIKNEEGK